MVCLDNDLQVTEEEDQVKAEKPEDPSQDQQQENGQTENQNHQEPAQTNLNEKDADQTELGTISDANNSNFQQHKVHNWIESSQKYFPDSSHEGESEPALEEESDLPSDAFSQRDEEKKSSNAKRSRKKKSGKSRKKSPFDISRSQDEANQHENIKNSATNETVQNALKGFVKDEQDLLSTQAKTVDVTKYQSDSPLKKPVKTVHIGKLSSATQNIASNSEAVEAVFSALHNSTSEISKTLTEEINKSSPTSRKNKRPLSFSGNVEDSHVDQTKEVSKSRNQKENYGIFHHTSSQNKDKSGQGHYQNSDSRPNYDIDDSFVDEELERLFMDKEGHTDNDQNIQVDSFPTEEDKRNAPWRKARESKKAKRKYSTPVNGERWSATHEKLGSISNYTHELAFGNGKDRYRKTIDKILKHKRKSTMKGLNNLCKGKAFKLSDIMLDEDFNHFEGLSLGTQLECTFTPDSATVKRAHYDILKDWLTKKPLDSYLVGKYDISDLRVEDIKPSLKIDKTVRECLLDFNSQVFDLLNGQSLPVQQTNVFSKPKNETEETVGNVFRQVHQYMDFVVTQAKQSNRQGGSQVNDYSRNQESEDRYEPSPERSVLNNERPGSGSSSEGVDQQYMSDEREECKPTKPKHKRKKKKRKHKKSSKGSLKRHKNLPEYPSSDDDSIGSEPPSSRRKLHDSQEKDCYRPSNLPQKKKTTTGSRPKGINEHGMTHIMEEFYGDVDSLMNTSDVSLDGTSTTEKHLPPLQESLSNSVSNDRKVDSVITEEMTKTKQHLTDILPDSIKKKAQESPAGLLGKKSGFLSSSSKTGEGEVERDEAENSRKIQTNSQLQTSIPTLSLGTTEGSRSRDKHLDSESAIPKNNTGSLAKEEPRCESPIKANPRVSLVPYAIQDEPPIPSNAESRVSEEKDVRESSQHRRSSYQRTPEKNVSTSKSPSHRKSTKRKQIPLPKPYSEQLHVSKKCVKSPVVAASKPQVDNTFVDSYSSLLRDAYAENPTMNFNPSFDVTKAPQGHFRNPYNQWWSIMQFFFEESKSSCDMNFIEQWLPEWTKCFPSRVLPENSFLLALSLATDKMPQIETVDKEVATDDALEFSDVGDDMNEYGSLLGENEPPVTGRERALSVNSSGSATENNSGDFFNDDGSSAKAARKSAKRVNTLALAFKQAVEAKKQAGHTTGPILPLVRKIKPGIRNRIKMSAAKETGKPPKPKTPTSKVSGDVQPIPYGEETNPNVSLSTFIDPELDSRIKTVMEESVQDFKSNLLCSVEKSLGPQKWNQNHSPSSFYNQSNQIRHLAALSDQTKKLFEELRQCNQSKWVVSKSNIAVQTDFSKIPGRMVSRSEQNSLQQEPVKIMSNEQQMKMQTGKPESRLSHTGEKTKETKSNVFQINVHLSQGGENETSKIASKQPLQLASTVHSEPGMALTKMVQPTSTTADQASTLPSQIPSVSLPSQAKTPGSSAPQLTFSTQEITSATPTTSQTTTVLPKQTAESPVNKANSEGTVKDAGKGNALITSEKKKTDQESTPVSGQQGSSPEIVPTQAGTKPISIRGSVPKLKFSLSKNALSFSQKPSAFEAPRSTAPTLSFVEFPKVDQPTTTLQTEAASGSTPKGVPPPIGVKTPVSVSQEATIPSHPVAHDLIVKEVEPSTSLPSTTVTLTQSTTSTLSSTTTISAAVATAEEKPGEGEGTSTSAAVIGLVSLERMEIPGLGVPEEAVPLPESPPTKSKSTPTSNTQTSSTSVALNVTYPITTRNMEKAQEPVQSGTFSLDAIPLPPSGKVTGKTSKSLKWQEWKKKQQEAQTTPEVVPETPGISEPPSSSAGPVKKVDQIPPVSTLTQWPPKSVAEDMPPPPLPPLLKAALGLPLSSTDAPIQKTPPSTLPAPQNQPPPQSQQAGWYGPQYRPPWPGGWDQRGPPPRGWGGVQGGQWRPTGGQWGPPPRGRGPWEHQPRQGYWDQQQTPHQMQQPPSHQPQQPPPQPQQPPQWGGGNGEQQRPQENNQAGEWGGQFPQQNWQQPPPGWRPPHPSNDPRPPYPQPPPGPHSHMPPPLLPPNELPPHNPPWQATSPSQPERPPNENMAKPMMRSTPPRLERPQPAKNIRMFVFKQGQPVSKSVQQFLAHLGAKIFDPFNVVALQALPKVETLVLLHIGDLKKIHQVPNLLALKTQEWVTFATFESVTDIKLKTYKVILKAGGIAVPDDSFLLSLQPESLEAICGFMVKQRRSRNGEPWYLLVHNRVLTQLLGSREDDRMCKLLVILTQYEEEGVVRVLRSPSFDNTPLPPHEYLSVMLRLQAEYAEQTRHTVLLTDLPQNDVRAIPFLQQGISLMNLPNFMTAIVGSSALPIIPYSRPYCGLKSDDRYLDSYLSNAADLLSPVTISKLTAASST